MKIFLVLQWVFFVSASIFIGVTEARGSNLIRYRAQRYGSYYSSVYYSYSGGKGHARYSRVYSHTANHYPALYNYMFDWLKTKQFKVYKNTPSGFISVCKNYEANENGTYLGIFTCPLPFVPQDHSYCCGLTNAQYCCKFWDLPLNLAAAWIGALMGVLFLITSVYIIRQLCISRRIANEVKRKRMAIRRIGRLRRHGRRITSGSVWAHALFERLHAPSNYSENTIPEEDETENEVDKKEERNRDIQRKVIGVMASNIKKDSSQKHNDVKDTSDAEDGLVAEDDARGYKFDIKHKRQTSGENYLVEMNSNCNGIKHESFTNRAFLSSLSENTNTVDIPNSYYPLKPLRNSPRIKFNNRSKTQF